MKCVISILLSLLLGSVIFEKVLLAGQISVINPSAGSEITGVASVLPQSPSSQSSSGLLTPNNISLSNGDGQKSFRYQIYRDFFTGTPFKSFTDAQLVMVKSQLLDVLRTYGIEDEIKDLIKEQLALVAQ